MRNLMLFCLVLAGCAPAPSVPTGTETDFRGADLLAANPLATRLPLAVPPNVSGYAVALSPSETQLAYVTSDGLFVSDLGGTARKVANSNGSLRLGGLMWSPDGQAVLLSENEVEASCTDNGHGQTCSSSSADDFGRLERVAIADGTRTVLAQHVYGLQSPVLLPDHQTALLVGDTSGDNAPITQHLYRLDLTSAKLTPLVVDRNCAHPCISFDGERIAYMDGNELDVVTVADGTVKTLGQDDNAEEDFPLWSADDQTVHLALTDRRDTLPLTNFPLDGSAGKPGSIPVPHMYAAFSPMPDGKHILAFAPAMPGQTGWLDLLDLDQTTSLATVAQGNFLQFTGKGNDFLCAIGITYYQHYYLVRPANSWR